MKKRFFINYSLTFLFCFISINLFAVIKSPPKKAILPNGLRVIVVEDKSLPLVAATLVFDAQPYFQLNDNDGISIVYKYLLDGSSVKGKKRFDLNKELDSSGAVLEFGGGHDSFYIACHGSSDNLDLSLNVLFELGFQLEPSQDEFVRAKKDALRYVDNFSRFPLNSGYLERQLWKDLFPSKALECLGPICKDALEQLTLKDLNQLGGSVLRPNAAVLVVIGNVDSSHVFKKSLELFGSLKATNTTELTASVFAEPSAFNDKENTEYYDITNTEVAIAFAAPSFMSPDMPAVYLWQALLHDINNSWLDDNFLRFFSQIKNFSARYLPKKDQGMFLITFTSLDPNISHPAGQIISSLANLHISPPQSKELQKAIAVMQLKDLEKRESRLERAFDLAISELRGNYRVADSLVALFNRVTSLEMAEVAENIFSSGKFAIRVAKPLEQQDILQNPSLTKTLSNGAKLLVRSHTGSELVGLTIMLTFDPCDFAEKSVNTNVLLAEIAADFINQNDNKYIKNRLDEIGAKIEAQASSKAFVITAKTQNHFLPDLLDIIGELIVQPKHDQKSFERAKERLIEKHTQEKFSSQGIIQKQLMEILYPGMHLTKTNINYESIRDITYQEVNEAYRSWAMASNLYISVVGNFSPQEVANLIEKTFQNVKTGESVSKTKCPLWVSQPLDKTIIKHVSLPNTAKEAFIVVGFRMQPFESFSSPEELYSKFGTNTVFSHVLFSGSNSLLKAELDKIDANLGVSGGFVANQQYALLVMTAMVPLNKIDEAQAIIQNLIATVPEMNISEHDIVSTRNRLKSFFNLSLQASDIQSLALCEFIASGLPENFLEQMLCVFDYIEPKHIYEGAKNNFSHYLMLIAAPEQAN